MDASIWETCVLVPGLTRGECASWVQAWGTIGALAVAIAIAWWQGVVARRLHAEQLALAEKERAARSEYRWMVALSVVAQLKRAALQIIELLTRAPGPSGLALALSMFDDARRRLTEVPIFDLPNATFADDLIALNQGCSVAREALTIAPNFDVGPMRTVIAGCDRVLEKVVAARKPPPAGPVRPA